jgi:dGTPase
MERWIERKRHCDEPGYVSKPFNAIGPDAEFQRDRARVIHSAAFRRLQSKTQVLGIGESDFYRTRLTHSLEVSQIGTSILRTLSDRITDDVPWGKHLPCDGLIETIGLLHDLGHPPFGHGEVALNFMMKDHGGFEGNGQTLRIMAKLGEYSPSHGLDLTRRSFFGALKYPCLYSEVAINPFQVNSPLGLKPPKCIFDDESAIRTWILEPFTVADREKFIKSEISEQDGTQVHSKPLYKSLDTSILELADDTAYGVHDFEDALALQLIDEKKWRDSIAPQISGIATDGIQGKSIDFYNQKLFSGSGKDRKHAISKLVGYFVESTEIKENKDFTDPLLRYNAVFPEEQTQVLKILKKFVVEQVIMRPQVQTLEYKGQQIVLKLFEVLIENPKRLLPKNTYETFSQCSNDQEKMRCISDFISGMTDPYATKLFHRLFSPDIGSIYDRI